MNNQIINKIFLQFIFAFIATVFIFVTEISVMYLFLLLVCISILLFIYKKFSYKMIILQKIENKIMNFIDFPFVKTIILFLLLFIELKIINSNNNFILFINSGMIFIAGFYFFYDNEYIKYKISKNKLKNENTTDNNN